MSWPEHTVIGGMLGSRHPSTSVPQEESLFPRNKSINAVPFGHGLSKAGAQVLHSCSACVTSALVMTPARSCLGVRYGTGVPLVPASVFLLLPIFLLFLLLLLCPLH